MKKLGLIPKLIIAIALGIIFGAFFPRRVVEILATFNSIFGNFLNFVIPLIIVGFIVAGIAELGTSAGKMLGVTTLFAYVSTLIAGFFAYFVASKLFPFFIATTKTLSNAVNPEDHLLKPLFQIEMTPLMPVTTALILAFLLGLGIASVKGKTLLNASIEFQHIVKKTIEKAIIPLLPIHIMGIFANMTYAGEVSRILSVFWKVFLIVLAMHILMIIFQFAVACLVGKKNLISCLKNQIPGYLTAVGTQSSAATIPVNLECAEKNKVSRGVREFVVPLCATIHLSGSTITLTSCAIAIMLLNGMALSFSQFAGFIAMLGVTMVAAPGVPGGAVMAALGVLQTNLGFSEAQLSLMIALYIAQDSFGTACNISGDNAIAILVDAFKDKLTPKNASYSKDTPENVS
ncbi:MULTISPECIES: dicarboxylate/amino acid:cation symporter [Clostridium]|uniref:Dicarboxylate/amino acid:cation symporter n=1 Tax=Clostridium senegalense TaxID=1465809 RepID=A0A6M0H7P5_9CLOT|nr:MULTISPECIES: dicarboxylate/amino acid:cation symporter [Clostridium]NEU06659.1 dicarboxylate/amino acid:cation symporter [Clostridium senegalense]